MTTAGMDGLRTDQAPPLHVPTMFYLVAPVSLAVAGGMMLLHPQDFGHRWTPGLLAATHLVTLGYLGSIMLGSVYQVAPVVAGAPVPAARTAGAVLACWVLGVAALVAAFLGLPLFELAAVLLAAALLAFLGPVGLALARAPTRGATVGGMRAAAFGLLLTATLGISGALVRGGGLEFDLMSLVNAHAGVGALVWVGGLLTAVSWQVVPMFYLAAPPPRWSLWPTVLAVATTGPALTMAGLAGVGDLAIGAVALPLAVVVWGVHPVVTARAIHGRRRKRADFSLRFWLAGLACGGTCLMLFIGAVLGVDPRWALALGWTAGVGWAGLITHGMLSRIVPFLVWFHRFSPLLGKVPVPTMRELLPEARLRPALALHVATVVAGLLAILTSATILVSMTGACLLATSVLLWLNLANTLRRQP